MMSTTIIQEIEAAASEPIPEVAVPISIKEMLAELEGVFPMDESIVEGTTP